MILEVYRTRSGSGPDGTLESTARPQRAFPSGAAGRYAAANAMRMRLGGVPFGVGAPLLEGMDRDPSIEFHAEPPTRLVEELRAGRLDAALVSSVEAIRTPGYRVAPGLSICSDGPARSVRAFARRERRIRTVGLDAGSETSVALLRILLARVLHAENCTFTRIRPHLEPDAMAEDLVLLIGDCGLHANPGQREVHDLGALWKQWTGLPFVFALWLIAPGAPAAPLLERLRAARALAVANGVEDGTGGAIRYGLGERELAGLMRFRREAAALNLIDPRVLPTFLDASTGADDGSAG